MKEFCTWTSEERCGTYSTLVCLFRYLNTGVVTDIFLTLLFHYKYFLFLFLFVWFVLFICLTFIPALSSEKPDLTYSEPRTEAGNRENMLKFPQEELPFTYHPGSGASADMRPGRSFPAHIFQPAVLLSPPQQKSTQELSSLQNGEISLTAVDLGVCVCITVSVSHYLWRCIFHGKFLIGMLRYISPIAGISYSCTQIGTSFVTMPVAGQLLHFLLSICWQQSCQRQSRLTFLFCTHFDYLICVIAEALCEWPAAHHFRSADGVIQPPSPFNGGTTEAWDFCFCNVADTTGCL